MSSFAERETDPMTARLDFIRVLAPLACAFGMPAAALATELGSALDIDCMLGAEVASAHLSSATSMPHAALNACDAATSTARFFDRLHAEVTSIDKAGSADGAFDLGARGVKRGLIRWISNSNGNWHDAANWVGNVVPIDGDNVGFGVGEGDLQIDTVDTDNAGNGVVLPNSILQSERMMMFSDASAGGDPQFADDGVTFDTIQVNGTGGVPVVFNVPVTAVTLSSNRHGAVFNREITVAEILARSQHQDRWQINASATSPIGRVTINEDRGPDGDSIDGSFTINSTLGIELPEQVWGRVIVGTDGVVNVGQYLYSQYVNAALNNNINPITLDGVLTAERFTVIDRALGTSSDIAVGTYGRIGNASADFAVDFISGDGLLTVVGDPLIFFDGFEPD
jgi:hypothetical protein